MYLPFWKRLMLKSLRRYTSLSFRFKLEIFSTIKSINAAWFGGLSKATTVVGSVLKKCKKGLCNSELSKQRFFLIWQATPLSFLFLSNRGISYRGKFTSESGTVWSSFDSVIPLITPLVLLAMHFISSFFESKLLMFICRKYKPFSLSGSHMVELISGDLWIGHVLDLHLLIIIKELIKNGITFIF